MMAEEVKAAEQTAVAEQKKTETRVSDPTLGIFGSTDNFTLAWQQAQALAKSSIIPANFQNRPENVLIAIEQANRLNISPFMVMQNIFIIQGRPSWSSKFLIAMINGSGKFDEELHYDETSDKNGKPYSCLAWTKKNGRRVEGVRVDMAMADAEGWTKKNGSKWLTIPGIMLRYRAASFFASLNCPELTLGLYTQEEMIDNDFSKTPDDIRVEVQQEISENANSVELDIDGEILDENGKPVFA